MEAINSKLRSGETVYFELSGSFLKLTLDSSRPPYVGTITQAEVISKPRPLLLKDPKKSHPLNCGARVLRGLAKEVAKTPYYLEKILDPNIFTAEQLVDIQVRRFRAHMADKRETRAMDIDGVGYTNRLWAEVVYGAKPGWLFGVGTGDEVIALTGIFGISEQTGMMSKTYFGSTKQTSIKKNLHRYAIIQGFPHFDKSRGAIENIQVQLEDNAVYREKTIKGYVALTQKYNTDVMIYIDSDLNIHKFYRDGQYQFVDCNNSI